MSQLQKLRAKQNKVKVVFSFEKTISGVEVMVKSRKLGELITEFMVDYNNGNYDNFESLVNPRDIYYSFMFSTNHTRKLIHGRTINMTFLKNLRTKSTVKLSIDNVFTNQEIRVYIELFETYLMKIKQLHNDKKIEVVEN